MKRLIPEEHRSWTTSAIIVAAATVGMVGVLVYLRQIIGFLSKVVSALSPFMVGAALAFVTMPVSRALERLLSATFWRTSRKKRGLRLTASLVSFVLLVGLLAAFLAVVMPRMLDSIKELATQINWFITHHQDGVNSLLARFGFIDEQATQINTAWENIVTTATRYINNWVDILRSTGSMAYQLVYQLFVGLVVCFYFLYQRRIIANRGKKVLTAALKKETAETLIHWMRRAHIIFSGFIAGKLLDSFIIGVICYIGMLVMRLEYPVLISVIIGVTNVLPFFGPLIGAIPSILVLLILNPMSALKFGIFVLILQQFDGNILGPKILGDYTGISPLWTMFAILLGSALFGFVGMLLSVPTFAVLYALVKTIVERRLTKRGLSTRRDDFDGDRMGRIDK